MSLAGVRIDWRAAVDQRVEKGKRAVETESLSAKLQDEERRRPCRLDVDRDELGGLQPGLRSQLRCIDGDLLPQYGLHGATRLEEDRLRGHGAGARARRAKRISSVVTALS